MTNQFAVPPVTTGLTVPASIDYTSKDFLGFMSSLQTYAQTAMPGWTIGASEGDIGLAIIEAFAYQGDIMSYYGDRISQEAYINTATQRQSLLNIAALLGYTVSNGQPATGTVTFQTYAGQPATLVPAGTQLMSGFNATTDTTVVYEIDAGQASYLVPANGVGTLTLSVTQGETQANYIAGTSDGSLGQSFSLPQTGVIDGTVTVFVEQPGSNPVQWAYAQFLGDYGPGSLVFTTFLDSAGLTWIEFGDNINGAVPVTGAQILSTYRVGAGSAGNVSAGSVGTFLAPITSVATQLLTGNVYNSSAMTGGTDPESNDQIRTNAPASFTAVNRAVSLPDFVAIAQNVPGVTAATAVALHSTSVSLYLMGNNNQAASTALQAAVLAAFSGKTLAGVTVSAAAPTLVPIDVGTQAQTPAAPAVSTATTGGTVAGGTYQVEVSYTNATGETLVSSTSSITTTGTTSTITITSPPAENYATNWYAYVTQVGGTSFTRQQTAGSPTAIGTNLTLTAPPTSSGAAPPVANTTGIPVQVSVLPGFSNAGVSASVQSALNTLFSNPNTYFGQVVTVGAVYGTLLAIPGVSYVVVPVISREDAPQTGTNAIALRAFEIAVPGYFTVNATGGV